MGDAGQECLLKQVTASRKAGRVMAFLSRLSAVRQGLVPHPPQGMVCQALDLFATRSARVSPGLHTHMERPPLLRRLPPPCVRACWKVYSFRKELRSEKPAAQCEATVHGVFGILQ
jgi:hypothetical protein